MSNRATRLERRQMTIQTALEWAFGIEFAQLTAPENAIITPSRAFGTEYVLMQRAKLGGVRIDVSPGRSRPHDDADHLADLVSNLPSLYGGFAMATLVAEFARAFRSPDWMPDATPKLEPVEWRRRNHLGRMARTEVVRQYPVTIEMPHPRNPRHKIKRRVQVVEEWCPCIWNPSHQEIDSARELYSDWRAVLEYVLQRCALGGLSVIELLPHLPPADPWKAKGGR